MHLYALLNSLLGSESLDMCMHVYAATKLILNNHTVYNTIGHGLQLFLFVCYGCMHWAFRVPLLY